MPTVLRLLGRPQAERGHRPVDLPAKALALLGYLAVSPSAPPRERVLGLLWGESAEEAARKNLRNVLWTVRKALGEDAVLAQGDGLALGAGLDVDARRLPDHPVDDPAGLLALYRGPFLDGLSLADAPEYELWLTGARESLAQVFLYRMEAALGDLAERRAWEEVASIAREALVRDPTRESFSRSLMTALAELGQRAEALKQYELLKAYLGAELGVDPSPETTALRDALARRAVVASRQRPERRPAAARSEAREPESLFVGRDAELTALDSELATVRLGRPRIVLLMGELGIGKSRLWREWSRRLPPDCRPLEARCVEAASGLPFAPLVDLFGSYPRVRELLRGPSPLPDVWLVEVARLLPQLRADAPSLPDSVALPPEEGRRRVFEAFTQVLLALEDRPLVIFVDDAHWADRASLEWLSYLVYRMRGEPLLLILAYRPEEAPPALAHQIAGWSREGLLRRVQLARLGPEETAQLISGLRVSPAIAHTLQAHSAGNPYFLVELSRNMDSVESGTVPVALADLVRSRLERLSEPARVALQAAAVLDPELDLALLVGITGQGEDEALDALDELLSGGVLAEQAGRFVFSHPLVPRIVRDGLNAARAGVLNRRAAHALISARLGRNEAVSGLIADHFAAAGDAAEAARYADRAADHAQSLAAFDEAVRFRERAHAMEPTAERSLLLGQALYRAGRLAAAREAYTAALAEAETRREKAVAARAALGIGETYVPTGWADEVLHWAGQALGHLDSEADPAGHARAHFLLGVGYLRRGGSHLEQAEQDLLESARISEAYALPELTGARFELANARAERGDLRGAVALYADTAEAARATREPNLEALSLNNLAYHLMLLGETEAARERIGQAFGVADAFGLSMAREYLYSTRGEIALAERQWDEAEKWINASLGEAQARNNAAHVAKCRANLARVAQGRGDLDAALILLEEAAESAAPLTARFMQSQIDLWLCDLYLERGEFLAAAGALARAEARLEGSHYGGLLSAAARLRARLQPRPEERGSDR